MKNVGDLLVDSFRINAAYADELALEAKRAGDGGEGRHDIKAECHHIEPDAGHRYPGHAHRPAAVDGQCGYELRSGPSPKAPVATNSTPADTNKQE